MPSTIRGRPVWTEELSVPAEGDLADPASVTQPLQTLADNARWLFEILTSSGVALVRRVADTAALKQLVGMPDGAVASVPRVGVYVFVAGSTLAEALPWIVAPAQGAGRWILPGEVLRNVAGGLCVLDGAAKVPAAQLRFAIVDRFVPSTRGILRNIATSFSDVPDTTGRLNGVRAGDLVELDAVVSLASPGTPGDQQLGTMETRFAIGATFTGAVQATVNIVVLVASVPLRAQYVCTAADANAGYVEARVQARSVDALPIGASAEVPSLRMTLVRP